MFSSETCFGYEVLTDVNTIHRNAVREDIIHIKGLFV